MHVNLTTKRRENNKYKKKTSTFLNKIHIYIPYLPNCKTKQNAITLKKKNQLKLIEVRLIKLTINRIYQTKILYNRLTPKKFPAHLFTNIIDLFGLLTMVHNRTPACEENIY